MKKRLLKFFAIVADKRREATGDRYLLKPKIFVGFKYAIVGVFIDNQIE